MPEYKPIRDLGIDGDSRLLALFKKEVIKAKYVKDATRSSITKLRDVELHLQTSLLVDIWKKLIGDAIVFLKLKDDREKYHDAITLGTNKLYAFLKEFQDFEQLLYGAVENYRDHIAHVFRVFLLGHYIIKTAIGFENIDPNVKGLEISSEEKKAIWCILALTHDLGYPLEVIHEINQKVRSMLQKFGNIPVQELGYSYFTQFGSISDFTIRFLSSDIIAMNKGKFVTHLQAKYYQKFLNALSNFDHGVISSTILMKDLVYFRESDYMLDAHKPLEREDARQFLIRKEILRAIASHSCEDVYYLGIKNFPFMLTVCDEMQEWGRPRLVDITKRGGSETKLTINEFSGIAVDYGITFSFPANYNPSAAEIEYAGKEVTEYFGKKCDKWCNVLRSAVSGRDRNLKLSFRVEDRTSPHEGKWHSLKHTNPEQIKVIKNEPLEYSSPVL